jgi:heme/copper-type cytochrome/quinol oxidase subunit 2
VAIVSGAALVIYVPKLPTGSSSSTSATSFPPYINLPAGCVRPTNGFLIVADQNGFNDSIQHGAPVKHWPIIVVKLGATVNITVCNSDIQAHGFQVTHYFDSNIETVDPGQVVHVSFLANKAGDFEIYCSIFCSIHIFMQNGELIVKS